jgi:hypothetical protein
MLDPLFLLLVAAVGFGVRQLALSIPIPPEVVRQFREGQLSAVSGSPEQRIAEDEDEDGSSRASRWRDDDDADWLRNDGVNIDGTPMDRDLDIYGNPFGITDD